jgi:predicted DNA binding protein
MTQPPSQPGGRSTNRIAEVEFEIDDQAYLFVELSDVAAGRIQLEEVLHRDDGRLIEFFSGRECPRDAISAKAADRSAIDSARIVTEGEEGVLFRLAVSGACIVRTIEGEGAIPGSVVADDGAGRVIAQVPDAVDAADVIDAVDDEHPQARLVAHRQREVSTPVLTPWGVRQVLQERTTDRQWETLRTAYRYGYFDRPREHTGEEIADMLGISSATFSQHLRSALQNVLAPAVEQERDGE